MSLESQLNRNYRRPEQPKAPLRRNQGSYRPVPRYQSPSRPAPRPQPRPLNRPAASRENRPNATRPAPKPSAAARNELFQRRLLALSMLSQGPAPSPDRTTGRELAGYSSEAFTGKAPRFVDEANGFFPDASGALHPRRGRGYGMQAGNPKQQAQAARDVRQRGINERIMRGEQASRTPDGGNADVLHVVGKKLEKALGQIAANSPVGAGVGNVISQQTWDKLAPLFQRSPGEMPRVSFKKTPEGVAGYTFTGAAGRKAGVTVDRTMLSQLFSTDPHERKSAASFARNVLAHEFAHTQQANNRGGMQVEGGADAFKNAVAPLLGYLPERYDKKSAYSRAQRKYFTTQPLTQPNLRTALINQFPRVNQRLTSPKLRRVNLAQ